MGGDLAFDSRVKRVHGLRAELEVRLWGNFLSPLDWRHANRWKAAQVRGDQIRRGEDTVLAREMTAPCR